MGIRNKLLDFKHRLQDRKMYSIVLVVIGGITIWGMYQYKTASEMRQQLDNQYNRAFYDMSGYVQNVETLLAKALLTSTPSATAITLEEAWRQATLAQTNLGQLPISQPVLNSSSKFLTQVGDFAYTLSMQSIYNKQLTDEQYQTLSNLHGYAVGLNDSMNTLASDLGTGRLRWGELAKKGTPLFQKVSKNVSLQDFESLDKQFQEYPSLIYDGPFSDHLSDIQPKGLLGEELNADQAKAKVEAFIGKEKIQAINNTGSVNNANLKVHSYEVIYNGAPEGVRTTMDVTQKGGQVLWMINNRPVPDETLNIEQAKEAGLKFLQAQGYDSMVDTYFLKEDNTATINYAYQQDETVVYPDLIKLKIALDNGEVVGFESKGYIVNHERRQIPEAKISEEEARQILNPKLQIESAGLAIIPTEYKTEIFCYEFKGKLNDSDFLIYINAESGREERILMIINTPNGILTM